MTLDRQMDEYTGVRELNKGTYTVTVDCESCSVPESALTPGAKKRLRCLEANLTRIVDFMVADMLDTYNDSWSTFGKLTPKAFESRIRLTSVDMSAGLINIYFEDGGLFGEHVITVIVDDKKNKVWEARLEG